MVAGLDHLADVRLQRPKLLVCERLGLLFGVKANPLPKDEQLGFFDAVG